MAEDILPPLPPGEEQGLPSGGKKKGGFLSKLFSKKNEEPTEPSFAPITSEPPKPAPGVPDNINLDDIRKQLGLEPAFGEEVPEPPQLPSKEKKAEKKVGKKDLEGIHKQVLDFPQISEPPKIQPKTKSFILEEDLEEPAQIKLTQKPAPSRASAGDEKTDWTSDVKAEDKGARSSEFVKEVQPIAIEIKKKSDFIHEVTPEIEKSAEPPKTEFLEEVHPEKVKALAKEIKRKRFDEKRGIQYEPEVSLEEEKEPTEDELQIEAAIRVAIEESEEEAEEKILEPIQIHMGKKHEEKPVKKENHGIKHHLKEQLHKEHAHHEALHKEHDHKEPLHHEQEHAHHAELHQKHDRKEPLHHEHAHHEHAYHEALHQAGIHHIHHEKEEPEKPIEKHRTLIDVEKDLRQKLTEQIRKEERGKLVAEFDEKKKSLEKEFEEKSKEHESASTEKKKELDKREKEIEKQRQELEQEKIMIAGKSNKYDFKEKQLRKEKSEWAEEKEKMETEKKEFEDEKAEAEELKPKLAVMRKDYANLQSRMHEIYDKLKEFENKEAELHKLEQKIAEKELLLRKAQTRLEEAEASIKEKGFAGYLESEARQEPIVSPKFEEKDLIKETHMEVYELIDSCRSMIRVGNIGEAKKLYMQLREIYSNVKIRGPEKELLYTAIRELYDDIKLGEMEGPGA